MVTVEITALTLDFIGKVLLGITALLVHRRVRKEHGIDKRVLREMRLEQSIGFLAITFIVLGYLLHLKLLV